jgi:hypothetical protein
LPAGVMCVVSRGNCPCDCAATVSGKAQPMAAATKVKARSEEIFTGDLLSKVGTIFLGDTEVGDTEVGDPEDAGPATLEGSGHQDMRRMPTELQE